VRLPEHEPKFIMSNLSGCVVVRQPNEPVDLLLRRFRQELERAGIAGDVRRHVSFEKPSVRRRRKSAIARRR
jgi:small subunit ribosomal protein S21